MIGGALQGCDPHGLRGIIDMIHVSENDSTYRTVERPPFLIARIFPSLYFYFFFLWIVVRSGRLAQKRLYDDERWHESSVDVLRLLERTGVRFEVKGLEHVKDADGPVIFIGNHLSMLETTILPSFVLPYLPTTYVIKQSLLEYPVFRHVMKSRDPIAVTRINPRSDLKTVLEEGVERLSRGISIIIFPQTTRTAFDPAQFSTIGVKLAKKSGVKVIPVALLTDAWENGKKLKDFGKINPSKTVHFAFGEAMEISGKGTDEHQKIIDFIQQHLSRWQSNRGG